MTGTSGANAPRKSPPTEPGWVPTPRLILAANFALAGLLTALSLAGLVGVTDPSAYVGSVLLVVTVLPSNLLRFGRFSTDGRLRALARLRKPLGVSAGVWFIVHSAASVWELFDVRLEAPAEARGDAAGASPIPRLAEALYRDAAGDPEDERLAALLDPGGADGNGGRAEALLGLAERIESQNGDYPNLVSAAAALVTGGEGDERERAVRASRDVIRPLAAVGEAR